MTSSLLIHVFIWCTPWLPPSRSCTLWGVHMDITLSGVTLETVYSSRRRLALFPGCAWCPMRRRIGRVDGERADHQMFSWLHLQAAFKTSRVQCEPRNRWTGVSRTRADGHRSAQSILTLFTTGKMIGWTCRGHERSGCVGMLCFISCTRPIPCIWCL